MEMCVAARWVLALGLIHPVCTSLPILSEDVEESGHYLEGSGSGSGDWSDQGEITVLKVLPGSKIQTSEVTHWPPIDFDSEFVVVGNSKTFWENQEIISGLIGGGVTGVILAALLAALLIYKWQMKNDGGFILGQQFHGEEAVV